MALEFIPFRPYLLVYVFIVPLVMFSMNFTQIMPIYDFFVILKNLGFRALFCPYRKRDEPYIGSDDLIWSI